MIGLQKRNVGCNIPFTRRNRKFRLENQMVHVIPFGKLQKFWAVGWGDAYFLFFLVSSADLATLCNFPIFREVKLNHLMFTDGFSNRMVCVNGKHPLSTLNVRLPLAPSVSLGFRVENSPNISQIEIF